jgi:hypothetical protein
MATETDGGIRAVKAARNQALWREVNEPIRAVAEASEHMEFLCECANLECAETPNLTVAEYDRSEALARALSDRDRHDFPDVENVVEENERYAVVQKRGVAAEEAARLDPRSPA